MLIYEVSVNVLNSKDVENEFLFLPSSLKLYCQDLLSAYLLSLKKFKYRHLVCQIELLEKQLSEIDKRIEEFSLKNNSPILSIPGISHFSGTSIIAELGDICNYTKASQIIKFAGVAPYHYESSQFTAQHTAITKKGSRYLRKTLYQIILPVISNNEVFYAYYTKKLTEGKGHRCAQGHCIRKLLRVIYHLLSTRQPFNPKLLV